MLFGEKAVSHGAKTRGRAVWVPAFAGTTRFWICRHYEEQRDEAQRLLSQLRHVLRGELRSLSSEASVGSRREDHPRANQGSEARRSARWAEIRVCTPFGVGPSSGH